MNILKKWCILKKYKNYFLKILITYLNSKSSFEDLFMEEKFALKEK